MIEELSERFFKYVKIDTTSNEAIKKTPSNDGEFDLAKLLQIELKNLGINQVVLTENCYLYAKIPSNDKNRKKSIGFVAHLDTSPSVSGKNVKPLRFRYEGGNIKDKEGNPFIFENEELSKYRGKEIITSSGDTLLGADDKAGIAEIITAIEYVLKNNISHPDIYLAFTPDEEIGHQVKLLDYTIFKPDIAFTIDGGKEGEIEYGNFNAYKVDIHFNGRNIHPGYANGNLVSAIEILNFITGRIFEAKISPNESKNDEGFIHINYVNATEEKGEISLIIRDFEDEGINKKKMLIETIIENARLHFEEKYKNFKLLIDIKYTFQYENMEKIISKEKYLLDFLKETALKCGIEPILKRIRGGTDGATISKNGIPCPNIFTGGHNFHSKSEWIPLSSMEKATNFIIKIIEKL